MLDEAVGFLGRQLADFADDLRRRGAALAAAFVLDVGDEGGQCDGRVAVGDFEFVPGARSVGAGCGEVGAGEELRAS
ncbi:hypothetical protein [Bowdeniella nasicola]|uniref:hypothetical protein n=1 Tax=Bowdeniella nasicola TaxID=208480 RepID=UPI0011614A74|nr:hypothetical protein [Bowdeniella nasicola]